MGNQVSYAGKHVLITGGSTGIGLSLAKLFLEDGARVTLLARDATKLAAAKELLQDLHPAASIETVSADVADLASLKKKISDLERGKQGAVEVAVCNAGLSIPGLFVEQSVEDARRTMDVNYFGVYNTVKAVLPGMLSRGAGHVCLISSAAGLVGLVGYTTYAPSKYAVRGLADCLRSELLGTGVLVSLGYPPDTKTPGFATENLTKPPATTAISEFFQDTVYEPDVVAKSLFRGLKRGTFHLPNPDFMLSLLISHTSGVTPKPLGAALEILLAPILVIIVVVSRMLMDSIVLKTNKRIPMVRT